MPNPDNLDARRIERRFQTIEAQFPAFTLPADGGNLPTPTALFTVLASGVVGTGEATVAHGLSYTPKIYGIVMTTAGIIQQSTTVIDATNIYLKADAGSRQANIILGR